MTLRNLCHLAQMDTENIPHESKKKLDDTNPTNKKNRIKQNIWKKSHKSKHIEEIAKE